MAGVEKRKRSQALSNFTRSVNIFNSLIDDNASPILVTPQLEKLNSCWEKLEVAQDNFIGVTDIDIEMDKDGLIFLDEPGIRHGAALIRYSAFLKGEKDNEAMSLQRKAEEDRLLEEERRKTAAAETKVAEDAKLQEERERRFASNKAEFFSEVDAFKRLNLGLVDTLAESSGADMRFEWQKVKSDFKGLKDKMVRVVGIDHMQDPTQIEEKFVNDCEKIFLDTQKWFLSKLKDVPNTSGVSERVNDHSTKKEAVRLPKFQGDEKMSPYLKFPIWKKQWEVVIMEYDEKWRAGLLWDHIDDSARSKIIGCEAEYDEASERLNKFYGDPLKVVACVMKEVMSQQIMNDGDYKSLVSYSQSLENNFNRLSNLHLEHEMSNMSAMTSIMRKFPRLIAEKWNEYLSAKLPAIKARPFPTFIEWLGSQREVWERMVAADLGRRKVDPGAKFGSSFFADDDGTHGKRCFGCGEEGHIRRHCPKVKNSNLNFEKKPRKPPKIKKHWCAYHKDDGSKRCWSNSCQDLRKISDVAKRIQLLKENGDCPHCCGDHKPADCAYKERVCGGGKDDRGCTKTHNLHELFCSAAKVCFAVQKTL